MPETAARHLDLASPLERAALGAAPRQGPRAGRQVDLPPRAHFRRARGRQGRRSPACLKGRTSSTPRTPCARSAPESSASSSAPSAAAPAPGMSTAWASQAFASRARCSISAIPPPAAGSSWGRSRAARSRRPSTATPACASDRCGASSIRSSSWARTPCTRARADACPSPLPARARPHAHRLPHAGPFGAHQIGRVLAGLAAPGETTVVESEASRDHTERLLAHFDARITSLPGRWRW